MRSGCTDSSLYVTFMIYESVNYNVFFKVGEHIDRDCQSDPAVKKRNAFINKCSVKGCKQKEVLFEFISLLVLHNFV